MSYLRSFRIVADDDKIPLIENLLRSEGFEFEDEPFSRFCRRLIYEPKPLGSSLASFFGYIYIQDRSSMLPPLALNPPMASSILDICASPGSKSGFLAQLGGANSFVLANEPNPARLGTLRANMRQINMLNVSTCSYAGEKLPLTDGSWSHILLDPPCSGWGTEEKNPSVRKIWHGDKLRTLVNIQRKLLNKAASLLTPGGSLLYSTCTTNTAENQDQARYAEEYLGLKHVALSPFPGFHFEENSLGSGDLLVEAKDSAAQGFYLCLFRKDGAAHSCSPHLDFLENNKERNLPGLALDPDSLTNELFNPSALPPGQVRIFDKQVRFIPQAALGLLNENIKWQAASLGTINSGHKSSFILDPRIHNLLDPASYARIQLDDIKEIRSLLSGQSLNVDKNLEHVSLWWRDLPLCSARIKAGRIIPAFN